MREVFIKFNPYKLETQILIDGKAPKNNSNLNSLKDKRLQEWVDDLPGILDDELNSNEFKIIFQGTTADYEDLVDTVEKAEEEGFIIELDHIPAKEVADKELLIKNIFDDIQNGPFDELRQPDVVKAFNSAYSSEFEVNVVATMSAGKSTLINALLGQKLMPAQQEACTATITRIKDNDFAEEFSASAYNSGGRMLERYDPISYETMQKLNANPEISRIEMDGDIPFVDSDDIALVLVDTPGPNNSRDPEHKAATYRMLSESSKTVVLYILNATQLTTNDDYNLLSHVADSMKVGGKQSRERFIFVVNKLDQFNEGEDSVEGALSRVRDYLREVGGIENANIYPASALTALQIRTVLAHRENYKPRDIKQAEFNVMSLNGDDGSTEMHFEKYAPLTPSVRGRISRMLDEAVRNDDEYAQALIHSGIVPIEQSIKMYVNKYAKTAKIKNIVDTFSKKLESARSFEETKQEIAENQDKQKEILKNIDIIKSKLSSGNEAKKFKAEIERVNYDSEIQKTANSVIKKAQDRIIEQCNSADSKLSRRQAEYLCDDFRKFAESLQAETLVKLEEVITNNMVKNAEKLLDQYKAKISSLAQDINVGSVGLNPFKLMEGDITVQSNSIINGLVKTERVKTGEKWIENTSKRWWKPWTWFQEKGHYEDVYEDREFVDGNILATRFFSPVQKSLYENRDSAVKYAKEQTVRIKNEFAKKFDELDKVLQNKLGELSACTKDNANIEKIIKQSEEKLAWLEDIQSRVNSILEI